MPPGEGGIRRVRPRPLTTWLAAQDAFQYIELSCVIIFTSEYLLRLITCPQLVPFLVVRRSSMHDSHPETITRPPIMLGCVRAMVREAASGAPCAANQFTASPAHDIFTASALCVRRT